MTTFYKNIVVIDVITFDELVEFGKASGVPLINGMPWSFDYKGHPITHENDNCYLIPTPDGTMKFDRGDMLITNEKGEIYPSKIKAFSTSPKQEIVMDGLTTGRIVHYVLSESDAANINRRRVPEPKAGEGAQVHKGNHVQAGEHVAMIIVKAWPDEFGKDNPGVNGQCFLDGTDQYWVTSAKFDPTGQPGTWHWIEKA